jgi:hypothetical protein
MYKIFWLNFDYFGDGSFDSLDEAIQFAKSRCFEALIVTDSGSSVAVWSPIGGTKYLELFDVKT